MSLRLGFVRSQSQGSRQGQGKRPACRSVAAGMLVRQPVPWRTSQLRLLMCSSVMELGSRAEAPCVEASLALVAREEGHVLPCEVRWKRMRFLEGLCRMSCVFRADPPGVGWLAQPCCAALSR